MRSSRTHRLHLILAASALLASATFAAGRDTARGQRFSSPGVLDLAQHAQLLKGKAIPVDALDAGLAQQILAAPTLDQEHATLPFSDYLFACPAESKTCVAQHEQNLIAASTGVVRREQLRLVIKPASARAVTYIDWAEPTTKTADGDSETHWYLGTLPGSGFHQVEVQFGHDAPGSFLINPKNGKTAFVHSGSDIVALSPDKMRLVTFNPDNAPLTLRVAALDESGPRIEVECTAREDDRATAQFKGWRNAHGFDLLVQPEKSGATESISLRVAQSNGTWSVAVADAKRLAESGFVCR